MALKIKIRRMTDIFNELNKYFGSVLEGVGNIFIYKIPLLSKRGGTAEP